jgi:hypothetical protein
MISFFDKLLWTAIRENQLPNFDDGVWVVPVHPTLVRPLKQVHRQRFMLRLGPKAVRLLKAKGLR